MFEIKPMRGQQNQKRGFLILSYMAVLTNPAAAAAAKSLQLCPTLCDPMDGSPPGSPVPEILQARALEWVAISFSNAWKWKVKVKSLSRVQLLATPWTAAHQAPPSMGFARQEYWSGLPLWPQMAEVTPPCVRGESLLFPAIEMQQESFTSKRPHCKGYNMPD